MQKIRFVNNYAIDLIIH